MRKIEPKTARVYIDQFATTMKTLGINAPENGFTKSVSFSKEELQEWLQRLPTATREIKIYFGMYPSSKIVNESYAGMINEDNEGRFTTILWPCDESGEPTQNEEGEEEPPVNVGDLEP